jgi:hypothetical protein
MVVGALTGQVQHSGSGVPSTINVGNVSSFGFGKSLL